MVAALTEAEDHRREVALAAAEKIAPRGAVALAARILGNVTPGTLSEWARNRRNHGRPGVSSAEIAAIAATLPGTAPEVMSAPAAPAKPALTPRETHDAAFWRDKYNRAEKERHEMELLAEKLGGLRDMPIDSPAWVATPLKPQKSRSIIIAHTSDIHVGEVIDPAEVSDINAYNATIAQARMERYFATACTVGPRWLHESPCDGVLLTMGGDLISGDIHEELSRTNDLTSHEQVALVVEMYERGIAQLADAYGTVHVAAVPGNHGRTTPKPTAKLSARMSYDIMAAAILRKRMDADKRVTWSIASGYDVRVPVYGRTILVTHGDRMGTGGGQGFAGPVLPIIRGGHNVRRQSASVGLDCDLILMGHYHTSAAPPGILSNGSVPGYSEYGHGLRASVEPPKQWLARFSSTWGLCEALAVQLENAPRRWKAKA